MTKMIIFLDFDGVISTTRAYMNQTNEEDFYLRWFDPIACTFIRQICEKFNCQIVVTSTWRKMGYNDCVKIALAAHGLDKYVHSHWCTDDLWVQGMEYGTDRPLEIQTWLAENPNEIQYLILDDDTFKWTKHQKEKWVHTCVDNGLLLTHMVQIIDYMETKTGLKFR